MPHCTIIHIYMTEFTIFVVNTASYCCFRFLHSDCVTVAHLSCWYTLSELTHSALFDVSLDRLVGTYFVMFHYDDVRMGAIASQITSLTIVYSTVYSDADQRKHQSSASLAFVWGIHRDRWIPRTKGQLRGKCFHLMTSSCIWCILPTQNVYFTFFGRAHRSLLNLTYSFSCVPKVKSELCISTPTMICQV